MARLRIPGNQWTTLPETGPEGTVEVRAANGGLWVSTDTVPGELSGAHPLGAGEAIVLTAGLPIHVWPANHRGGAVMWMAI